LEITATDWAILSPLVDEALDLAPAQRVAWLKTNTTSGALSLAQCAQLEALIAQSQAPETDDLLSTMPSFARHKRDDAVFTSGDSIGPYELIERAGVGGMSEVWRAQRIDGAYEREVALKLPYTHANPASRDHFIRRMERERDLLAKLEHPNIGRFYDAGIAKTSLGAQPYLALEFVHGQSLLDYANGNKLTVEARCRLFLQVLGAVQYAHQHFVVHRDLKPSNILVRDDGQVILLDFGIAKVLDEDTLVGDATQLTREMGRAITLAYASPEQLLSEPITTASDVYSAGVIFYELLCGKRPFAGRDQSMMSLLDALGTSPPSLTSAVKSNTSIDASTFGINSLKSLAHSLSGDLVAIAAKALRCDKNARYPSAIMFADDLQRYLNDEPVLAREGAMLYSMQKFLRRQRVPLAIGSIGAIAAIGLGIVAFDQYQGQATVSAQADAVQKLMTTMLSGMSPDVAENKLFTARELLDRTVAVLPQDTLARQDPKLINQVTYLYEWINEFDKSIALQKKRIDEIGKRGRGALYLDALLNLTKTFISGFRREEAREYLGEIEDFVGTLNTLPPEQTLQIHYLRGWIALGEGNISAAESEFLHIDAIQASGVKFDPEWTSSYWFNRGRLARKMQKLDDAEHFFLLSIEHTDKIDQGKRGYTLQARIQLAEVWQEQGKDTLVLKELPALISELEKRYGETHRLSLGANYVFAISQLRLGKIVGAKSSAKIILEHAGESSEYRIRAKALLIDAALQCGDNDLTEREIAHWTTDKAFDDPDVLSPNQRRQFANRAYAAHFLNQRKNTEAYALLIGKDAQGQPHLTPTLRTRYMLAITLLRLGRLDEAQKEFESIKGEREKLFGPDDVGTNLIEAYLSVMPNSVVELEATKGQRLRTLLGSNPQMHTLLDATTQKLKSHVWRDFPFIYFNERS
jgi:serine/threonine protein kinase